MVFYCQRNCFDRKYTTTVTSCVRSKLLKLSDGTLCLPSEKKGGKKSKPTEVDCYEVAFEDTVFFPEGGGQPDDQGTVTRVPVEGDTAEAAGHVLRVLRKAGEAMHYIDKSYDEGTKVIQELDWLRRNDHMQQHSGQHLITALADNMFGYATNSWNLGTSVSTIELNTKVLSDEQMKALEQKVNEVIADAVDVTVREYEQDDPDLDESIRSRGLPADAVGSVRVVSIAGHDSNMCCGTHISNTLQLQSIKILGKEGGKQGNVNISFVAGDRLLSYLSELHRRENTLTSLLHTSPQDFAAIITKLQSNLKVSEKSSKEALRDLAVVEGKLFKMNNLDVPPHRNFCFYHRRVGDTEFLSWLAKELDDQQTVMVLTTGPDKGPGCLLLEGPPQIIEKIVPVVCEHFEGKGGGKTKFTAKVNCLNESKRIKCYSLIEDIIAEHYKETE